MSKKYLIFTIVFFLILSIPVESAKWCANNDSSTIELFEVCINLTNEPCLGCTVNVSIFNSNHIGVNTSIILNESGEGRYNTTIDSPLSIALYPMVWECRDSENIYAEYTWDILEIQETCPGENIAELNASLNALNLTLDAFEISLDQNWTQLWNYFNCTNATADLNDICTHLDVIINDLGVIEYDLDEIEDDMDSIQKDVGRTRTIVERDIQYADITSQFIGDYGNYIIGIIALLIFILVILALRAMRSKSKENEEYEDEYGEEVE